MLPFASSLSSQIGLLVSCTNKTAHHSCISELDQFAEYGLDGGLLLQRSCLEQGILKSGGAQSFELKRDVVTAVIKAYQCQPNFPTLLCEAVRLGHGLSATELAEISESLSLSLPQQLFVGHALACAEDPVQQQECQKFCELKSSEGAHSWVNGMLEDVATQARYLDQVERHYWSVSSPQHKADLSLILSPFDHTDGCEVNCLRTFNQVCMSGTHVQRDILSQLASAISVADAIEELGYGCVADAQLLREVISEFPLLTEHDVAKMVGMVARTHAGLVDSHGVYATFSMAVSKRFVDTSLMTTWNVDVIIAVLKQFEADIDWLNVVKALDHEGMNLPDSKAFQLLLSLYNDVHQEPFPMDLICTGVWTNKTGQLSLLRHAIGAASKTLSIPAPCKSGSLTEGLFGHKLTNGSQEGGCFSVYMLEVLGQLAEMGHGDTIRAALEDALRICPQQLLLGVAQIRTSWNAMQCEVLSTLLPRYIEEDFLSSSEIRQLWSVNPEIVTRALVGMQYENPGSLSRILEICQDLEILLVVLDTTPFLFSFHLASLAGKRGLVDLETWLTGGLRIHRDVMFQACLLFLREKSSVDCQNEPIGPGDIRHPLGLNLSLETTATFFKVLQANTSQLYSRAPVEGMKDLYSSLVRNNPRLLSMGSQQGPSEVFASDIDEEANSYFQRVYMGQLSIETLVEMLERFNKSSALREKEIFACMIQNLFDEYRFFPRYPEKELGITAVLFGLLIKHQLVSSITLGIALRCVLDALRKPLDSKMFSFGLTALEQFKDRVVEWPQYCNHLLQISHLKEAHTEMVDFIARALARVSPSHSDSSASLISHLDQQMTVVQSVSSPLEVPGEVLDVHPMKPATIKVGTRDHAGEALTQGHFSSLEEWQKYLQQPLIPTPSVLQQQQLLSTKPHNGKPEAQAENGDVKGNLIEARPAGQAGVLHSQSDQSIVINSGQKASKDVLSSLQSSTGIGTHMQTASVQSFYPSNRVPAIGGVPRQPSFSAGFGHALNIETLVQAAERRETPIEAPGSDVQDKIAFIINNISQVNLEAKANEFLAVAKDKYYPWFAQYMVMKRASIEPNFHELYLKFLDKVNSKILQKEIMKATYENCKVLLRSDLIKSSSEERSLLKNLGSWLGKLTIGRNQTLRAREIDPKSLIVEAYERGLMIAVIPFTSKVLEPCHSSLAYQPPNPWTMGILGLLMEIYSLSSLKMNLKFDIEVLFKNLGVEMKDVRPSQLLVGRGRELDGNPDFSGKDSGLNHHAVSGAQTVSTVNALKQMELLPDLSPPAPFVGSFNARISASASANSALEEDRGISSIASERNLASQEGAVSTSQPPFSVGQVAMLSIPNLTSYVVLNTKLASLGQQLQLDRIVPLGMEQAILEIIQPVVDRSVTIACMTTRELVMKDYAMELDESRTHQAANLMVASLAGSLAHVTCKEPLRVAMSSHLRTMLQTLSGGVDVDQAVQLVTNDNLDLGCAVIEKAATEKALLKLEEVLGPALNLRKQQRDVMGGSFFDASLYSQGIFSRLPESLRPKPGRLANTQQRVYEDFARLPWQNQSSQGPVTSGSSQLGSSMRRVDYSGNSSQGAVGRPAVASYGATQAIESIVDDLDHRMSASISLGTNGSVMLVEDTHQQELTSNPRNLSELAASEAVGLAQVSPVIAASSSRFHLDQQGNAELKATTGETLDNYQLIAQKLDIAISTSSASGFTQLPSDDEIRALVAEIPEIIAHCISKDEAALAIAQKVFKRLFENTSSHLFISVHLAILESIRDVCKRVVKELTNWVMFQPEEDKKFHREVTIGLIRSELLYLTEYNNHLSKLMDGGRNTAATDFAIYLVKTCVSQDSGVRPAEFPNVIEVLSKLAHRPGSPESLQQLVESAKSASSSLTIAAPVKEDKSRLLKERKPTFIRGYREDNKLATLDSSSADPAGLQEQAANLFEEWARICDSSTFNDKAYAVYMSLLEHSGLLKDDDTADSFFRILLELAVKHTLSETSQSSSAHLGQGLSFTAIDTFAKLVVLLVKCYMLEPAMSKVNILNKVLSVTARVIQKDAEERQGSFQPRPYFRLFVTWLIDLNSPDPTNFQVLTAFGNALWSLQPLQVPSWSFAWLELISHRMFMPKLLLISSQKGWPLFQRLLVSLFKFMEPYLRHAELSDPIRVLYKGTLRVLLVLLHDFPEFLCDHHFSFCDVIPPSCIQMRNLILSAFPRNMRLPDPFTPNLKVDLLPEISQPPRILSDVEFSLKSKQLKAEVDEYLKTRQPLSLLAVDLKQRLMLSPHDVSVYGTRYNVSLINALVLYVGMQAIHQLQSKTTPQQLAVPTAPITHSAPMDIFQRLIVDLDSEGRYLFLNAVANQLRYPNNHTHYFSCVILYLFAEANQEFIQEQITRVLLERLIVNRPHPWGLLITFIELIKNPRYNFWSHAFTRCAPEIEKLFESVARSCMGPPLKSAEDDLGSSLTVEGIKS